MKAEMEIKVDQLIWAAQEQLDNENRYSTDGKIWHTLDQSRKADSFHGFYKGEQWMWSMCAILSIDSTKLYNIARLVRKWEAKRDYMISFPIEKHSKAILKYLCEQPEEKRYCIRKEKDYYLDWYNKWVAHKNKSAS